ncbi:MAG: hypothetical protein KKA07_03095 [Bacteroidetes bacterium]|nr:hypothetical protein [Bacteroidota bacterium]MBU1718037.1 hypothetical protein [Bacteroidota bacterium]
MFAELKHYKNTDHFFFQSGQNLKEQSKDAPDLPGVYYIMRLAKGNIDLVYIGKAGAISQNGQFKEQGLRGRINNQQDGMPRQEFFEKKIRAEKIDGLDIYWFVTFDKQHRDLPAYVEGLLIQRHSELYGRLPEWNKEYSKKR